MKRDKAYEYFSEYLEGTMDAHLRAQMDRLLSEDFQLQQDYQAFVASVEDLNGLHAIEVEIPADLHEKISSRLDHHLYQAAAQVKVPWFVRWRLALTGVAVAAAVVGGVIALLPQDESASGFGAGIAPVATVRSPLRIVSDREGTFLRYTARREAKISVKRIEDGAVLTTYEIRANEELNVPLVYRGERATPLEVRLEGNDEKLIVVMPGQERSESRVGSGTGLEMLMAMSAFYGRPVVLESGDTGQQVRWAFSTDSVTQPETSLMNLSIEVQERLLRVRF